MRAQFLEHLPHLVAIDAKKSAGILYYHCHQLTDSALGRMACRNIIKDIEADEESAYRGTVVGTGSFHVEFLRLIYISCFFHMLSLLSIFIL